MGYRDSEFYGDNNGKLLWFAHEGLFDEIVKALPCEKWCHQEDIDDNCDGCAAYIAHNTLEKQIINEGVKFMISLVKECGKANETQ